MKYSKRQRHEIYKKALNSLLVSQFICHAIESVSGRDLDNECDFEHFPEFHFFTPVGYKYGDAFTDYINEHGFCSYEERGKIFRQTILEFCIEMTR